MARSDFNVTVKGLLAVGPGGSYHCTGLYAGYPKLVTSRTSSEVTAGTDRRKPTGRWIPPTAYSFRKERVVLQNGTCRAIYKRNPTSCSYGTHYSGVVGGAGGRFNGLNHFNDTLLELSAWNPTSQMLNRALIKARAKLKAQDVNLGVAFGERNQTARLVGDTAARLYKSLRHLKSGRIRRAMDELGITSRARQPRGQNVPSKWLELQYGWKPLLSDVYGAADALNGRSASDWRVTVKATETESIDKSRSFPPSTFDASVCRAQGTIGAFVRIDALPENAATIALSSLGVTNPLEIGWELVPFSFVVDWFLPIGDYLHSLDALLGYSSSGTYASYTRFIKLNWVDEGQYGTSGDWKVENEFKGTKSVVRVLRTVSTGVNIPTVPGMKDPRSLGHMANGLALLSQFFGRK